MNIRTFKEKVTNLDNYEENFKQFRIWAENCYDNYKKKKKIDWYSPGYYTEEYEEDFNYQWEYIDYDSILDLYNRMGWEIDKEIKKAGPKHDSDSNSVYYEFKFETIYEKIQTLNDNIEFSFALFVLVKNIKPGRNIYKEYFSLIYEGVKECGLKECLDLVNEKHIKTAFIAMWFDDSMENARSTITQAVRDSGYTPMLIDVKEHNNQIVPEIYKEIADSAFVIADLTGQRGGVYYEAGYAMAKGKPVILCCREDEKKKIHFDVAQINIIFWKNERDLLSRLEKRITATIGII